MNPAIGYKSRRVVVTGLGLVTCLGSGVNHVWSRLLEGDCGISRINNSEYETLPCKIAGMVPVGSDHGSLSITDQFTPSEMRTHPRAVLFAQAAAKEALTNANWSPQSDYDRFHTGVAIGTGMADLDYITNTGVTFRTAGIKKLSPYFIPNILLNMAAGSISIKFKFKGPNHTVSTACSTGLVAIGDSFNFIRLGKADVMVAGGTEACINPLSLGGFSRIHALSTKYNDAPDRASRPFDVDRDGFVMSEGAGVVILEELDHANRRNAPILAEILGYGIISDAYHKTSPEETGTAAARSMAAALSDASVCSTDVGYINAHATSTPTGDIAECRGIQELFGAHSTSLIVSSTKGAVGHLQGAAGAVEAIFTILATKYGKVPPTLNLSKTDEENTLNCTPHVAQNWTSNKRHISLTNSFGFWGTNASLCIGGYT